MQPWPHAATGVDKADSKPFCVQHIFWEGLSPCQAHAPTAVRRKVVPRLPDKPAWAQVRTGHSSHPHALSRSPSLGGLREGAFPSPPLPLLPPTQRALLALLLQEWGSPSNLSASARAVRAGGEAGAASGDSSHSPNSTSPHLSPASSPLLSHLIPRGPCAHDVYNVQDELFSPKCH